MVIALGTLTVKFVKYCVNTVKYNFIASGSVVKYCKCKVVRALYVFLWQNFNANDKFVDALALILALIIRSS